MGKLYLLAIVSVLSLGVVSYAPLVSAQSTENDCQTISIENTGPGSVNVVDCKDTSTIKVTCNNDATIDFSNDQVAQSGDVTVKGNTIAGKGVSGDATNQNAANIDVTAVCAALVAEETPAPTPTPTPAPTPAPVAKPAPKPAVAALPNTGNETMFEKALAASAISAALGLAILGSAKIYKRFNA